MCPKRIFGRKISAQRQPKGLYDRSAASKLVKTTLDLEIPTIAPA